MTCSFHDTKIVNGHFVRNNHCNLPLKSIVCAVTLAALAVFLGLIALGILCTPLSIPALTTAAIAAGATAWGTGATATGILSGILALVCLSGAGFLGYKAYKEWDM